MKIRLADNIRQLRKARSMTQEQLAEALGVTVGAVHKWETGQSMPEIKLLVEIAEFFEASVDAILGYGWDKGSMGEAAKRIKELRVERKYDEAARYAEKALQKYPNSFEVVYQSGTAYFLMMNPKAASRAIELLERSLKLIEQNTYDNVNEWAIKNDIAACYSYIGKFDKSVELLKENNFGGVNNSIIGCILSHHCGKPEEALEYLAAALINAQSVLYRVSLGYANAYAELGELGKAKDIMQLVFELGKGLREPNTISFMDKGDARALVALAEVCAMRGEDEEAYSYLKRAKTAALRFDAAPSYKLSDLKFYHGPDAMAYDDFGDTAMEGIERFIADDDAAPHLRPFWAKLIEEDMNDGKI